MSRSLERTLARLFGALSVLLVAGAVALVSSAFLKEAAPVNAPPPRAERSLGAVEAGSAIRDPKVSKLAGIRMSKTVVPKSEAAAKPAAPRLETLVRLKGIMDFGDPKLNEAIIEETRTGTSQSYRAGDRLKGVEAVVKKVDAGATLEYEGKEVRLEVRRDDRADSGPMAGPEGSSQTVTGGAGRRQP